MAAPIFVADEVVTAAKMNSLPKGVLGYAIIDTAQTGISGVTDLTGLSVTVDVAASRLIQITGHGLIVQRSSAGIAQCLIRESTTVLGEFGRHTLQSNEQHMADGGIVLAAPSAGSHTYKLSLTTSAGTVDTGAGATNPLFILVEDVGGS